MTEQVTGEELILDGEDANSEDEVVTSSTNNDDDSGEQTPEKKNSSNWKQLAAKKKELERELHSTRAELKKMQDWANSLYEKEEEKPFRVQEEQTLETKESKLEQKIFLIENPTAKEHIDDILAIQKKYNMELDDAWIFVRSKLPQESMTKKDFAVQSKAPTIPKDLTKITPEDALKLPKDVQAKWRKVNGWE